MSTNVLVVDDSATVRQQVCAALSQAGLSVSEAVDGVDGVAKIKAGSVDCVVCDVNMPNKNGIEMVAEVKKDIKFASLPIIMLTTEGAKDLIAKAKAAGACGWIVKPFKADMLVAAVKKLTNTN
ncbi:response regulator [Stieleria sp. JC731]|uniref:response regulator n=1 Tax=Pirellulaceae TaxID=2691357 RepID=UPI001E37D228|nr:response regulator [Stieleria sp. JC731]MCC9604006.1 response regulator [Stieleria sp. JC731]